MNYFSRRDWLGCLGLAAGVGVASTCQQIAKASLAPAGRADKHESNTSWTYARVDPRRVGEEAYEIYGGGGCMYAIFAAILSCRIDEAEEPFPAFPLHMMKYGAGGVSGWGTLCGALNGAAAIIGLFVVNKQDREQLTSDLFSWYETVDLPKYRPPMADSSTDIVATTSGSVLCHVSVGAWCHASGRKVKSKEKTERCRRLTVDVATKTVELLNQHCLIGNVEPESSPINQVASKASDEATTRAVMGKMRCNTCHKSAKDHVDFGHFLEAQEQ